MHGIKAVLVYRPKYDIETPAFAPKPPKHNNLETKQIQAGGMLIFAW